MQKSTFTRARIGMVTNAAGLEFAGSYYPAHTKNGKNNSAKWIGTMIQNDPDWTDSQGNRVKGKTRYFHLTIWNGKNAQPGKGMADIAAKNLSVGKAIDHIECRAEPYDHRVFENHVPLVSPATGQPVMVEGMNFVYVRHLEFGRDSKRQVARETEKYVVGQANFWSRPPEWDKDNTAGAEAWKLVMNIRKQAKWDGQSESFGYAKVVIPEGAQLTGFNQAPQPGMAPVAAADGLNANQPGPLPPVPQAPAAPQAPVAPPVSMGASTPF